MTTTRHQTVEAPSSPSNRAKGAAALAALALTVVFISGAPAFAQLVTYESEPRIGAPPDTQVSVSADSIFHYAGRKDAGTNPVFTEATFSTMAYYVEADTGIGLDGRLRVKAMSEAGLNALEEPPPSEFTVTADVKMSNDEGDTGTATITFSTGYNRSPAAGATP